jgi:hypothetical protein
VSGPIWGEPLPARRDQPAGSRARCLFPPFPVQISLVFPIKGRVPSRSRCPNSVCRGPDFPRARAIKTRLRSHSERGEKTLPPLYRRVFPPRRERSFFPAGNPSPRANSCPVGMRPICVSWCPATSASSVEPWPWCENSVSGLLALHEVNRTPARCCGPDFPRATRVKFTCPVPVLHPRSAVRAERF